MRVQWRGGGGGKGLSVLSGMLLLALTTWPSTIAARDTPTDRGTSRASTSRLYAGRGAERSRWAMLMSRSSGGARSGSSDGKDPPLPPGAGVGQGSLTEMRRHSTPSTHQRSSTGHSWSSLLATRWGLQGRGGFDGSEVLMKGLDHDQHQRQAATVTPPVSRAAATHAEPSIITPPVVNSPVPPNLFHPAPHSYRGPVVPSSNGPRYLKYVAVTANGTVSRSQIRKSELAALLGCPVRDLRLIDASFPGTCSAVLSRPSAIVLCVERVKVVIRRDVIMLFDPDSLDVAPLVPMLQGMMSSSQANSAPFEHLMLEAIVAHGCNRLTQRLHDLAPDIFRILQQLKFRHGTLNTFTRLLDELLPLRNRLSELHHIVQELRKAMNDVLMSDEDMAQMYLTSAAETGKNRRVDQHQEVEMLFENYLMQVEWCESEIREIEEAVKNTEDTVEIQLDLLRNRILRFELCLNIFGSVMSIGALTTGLFGMNLLSGMELHPTAFYTVTLALALTMLSTVGAALWYGIKAKVL